MKCAALQVMVQWLRWQVHCVVNELEVLVVACYLAFSDGFWILKPFFFFYLDTYL